MTKDQTLRRLRAANPVPVASAVDADDLFDRITSASPNPQLRRAPRTNRRRALVLVLALLVVGALASTAPAITNWIGGLIGPSEVNSEFTKAERRLSLPPGESWPDLNFPQDSVTSRGAGGSFAVSIAMAAWECYWVEAIRADDAGGQRQAEAALRDLLTNHVVVAPKGASENWSPAQTNGKPTAVFADDGGYQLKRRMYAEAAAGDSSLLAQSCRANGP